jgi:hypothetical protein
MFGLIVAILCLAGLVAIGRVLLRAHRADKGVDGRPSQGHTAPQIPRTTAPSQAKSFVSERRVAQESRRLIDEIEQFLADRDST